MAHDTKEFIEAAARQYMINYYQTEEGSERVWFIRQHYEYINQAIQQLDKRMAAWFFSQRSSYQSTLRWKIFIRFSQRIEVEENY